MRISREFLDETNQWIPAFAFANLSRFCIKFWYPADINCSLHEQLISYLAYIVYMLSRRGKMRNYFSTCYHAADPSLACRVSLNLCTKLPVNPNYTERRKRPVNPVSCFPAVVVFHACVSSVILQTSADVRIYIWH